MKINLTNDVNQFEEIVEQHKEQDKIMLISIDNEGNVSHLGNFDDIEQINEYNASDRVIDMHEEWR